MTTPSLAERTVPPVEAPPLLEVDRVSKYFGSVIALSEVSAVVRAGSVTCILGDNGAGKSTLIKILSASIHRTRAYIPSMACRCGSPRRGRH